jgi:hypothetical protein
MSYKIEMRSAIFEAFPGLAPALSRFTALSLSSRSRRPRPRLLIDTRLCTVLTHDCVLLGVASSRRSQRKGLTPPRFEKRMRVYSPTDRRRLFPFPSSRSQLETNLEDQHDAKTVTQRTRNPCLAHALGNSDNYQSRRHMLVSFCEF